MQGSNSLTNGIMELVLGLRLRRHMLVHFEGWSKEGRLLGMGASNPTHLGDTRMEIDSSPRMEIDSKDHFDPGFRTSDKMKNLAGFALFMLGCKP